MTAVAYMITGIALAEDAEFDPASVTPGVIGFVVTALFALAVIFLGVNLVRRLRRSRYRHEIREALAEEIAQQQEGREAESDGGSTPDPRP